MALVGRVKLWNGDRGYGFIKDEAGGPDIFLHCKEIHAIGVRRLNEGQTVEYDVGPGKEGRPKAVKVHKVT